LGENLSTIVVTKKVTVPAPVPPPTYTVEGLSEEQFHMIVALVGKTTGWETDDLYMQLKKQTTGYGTINRYDVVADDNERVLSLRMVKRHG
jgi:hypothetical protein